MNIPITSTGMTITRNGTRVEAPTNGLCRSVGRALRQIRKVRFPSRGPRVVFHVNDPLGSENVRFWHTKISFVSLFMSADWNYRHVIATKLLKRFVRVSEPRFSMSPDFNQQPPNYKRDSTAIGIQGVQWCNNRGRWRLGPYLKSPGSPHQIRLVN